MTARQIFEGVLIELSKVNAPSLLLSDFNYLFNKAVNQYINKRYNIYDIAQQNTDDLRVLKSTTILKPTLAYQAKAGVQKNSSNFATTTAEGEGATLDETNRADNTIVSTLLGATYEVNLPSDYLHLLNCVCVYKVKKTFKCYNRNTYVQFGAKRLTADSWAVIINDFYNRPTPERPYYYIHNVNASAVAATAPADDKIPTNPFNDPNGTDMVGDYNVVSNGDDNVNPVGTMNLPRTISLNGGSEISTVEREIAHRYGNASKVRMEIRYGKDNSIFELVEVMVDYVKAPQHIRLTQEQMDLTEDTSQIMEFPDYVCQEIINELVHVVMENTADPRLQTHIPISQSIANPAQAQAPQQQTKE